MSYTDLRDFAPEYAETFLTMSGAVLAVTLEKLGGGTLGEAYAGIWRYVVTRDGTEIGRAQDFETGTPHTHAQAAHALAAFFDPDV